MIDTVRLKVLGEWKSGSLPPGWYVHEGGKHDTSTDRTNHYRAVCHEHTGFRVTGTPSDATALEVSLPRLLHGSNGALLKSEEEVYESLRLVKDRMTNVIDLAPGFEPSISRLDAAWNFEIDGGIRTITPALENTRHPLVRRATTIHKGESIHWPGTEFRIRIYDKGKEVTGKESNVVRMEAQLRGKHVAPFNNAGIEGMGFRAYQVLRENVCKLQPRDIEQPRFSKIADLLAYMEQDQVRDSKGRDLFALYLNGLSRSTRFRLLAEIKAARINYTKIEVAALLPADHLPPVVEIAA